MKSTHSPLTTIATLRLAVLLAVSLTLVPHVAATPVHNPLAPYSVDVGATSTVFNSLVGFNGSVANFGAPWGSTWNFFQGNTSSGLQTFTATFQADPGSVFTGANLGFGQWSFSVPDGGYLWFSMDWTLPGAVYTGSNHQISTYHTFPSGTSWQVGPGGGNYQWWHRSNQGGGGFEFMPIMDHGVPLLLNNVSSFSVTFSAIILHGGAYFGDGNGAGLGFSNFSVNPIVVPGVPSTPAVPDGTSTALLFGVGILGLLSLGRWARA
ncbi:MAG: hypothetical protein HZC55_19575 [Verrucomicrobia bacterium]|jgi:hypothetical protein|nr:hypothetical protein [Verrucomicrobiota bacterium]